MACSRTNFTSLVRTLNVAGHSFVFLNEYDDDDCGVYDDDDDDDDVGVQKQNNTRNYSSNITVGNTRR
jgi:hypothetical protein